MYFFFFFFADGFWYTFSSLFLRVCFAVANISFQVMDGSAVKSLVRKMLTGLRFHMTQRLGTAHSVIRKMYQLYWWSFDEFGWYRSPQASTRCAKMDCWLDYAGSTFWFMFISMPVQLYVTSDKLFLVGKQVWLCYGQYSQLLNMQLIVREKLGAENL